MSRKVEEAQGAGIIGRSGGADTGTLIYPVSSFFVLPVTEGFRLDCPNQISVVPA